MTTETTGLILGFDPGGRTGEGSFGWSVCRSFEDSADGDSLQRLCTGIAHDAWEALCHVKEAIRTRGLQGSLQVRAAGIDSPMYWVKQGERRADNRVREELTQAKKRCQFTARLARVMPVNILMGACLVQGVMLGKYLREEWPDLKITEAHPKALWQLLKSHGEQYDIGMVKRLKKGIAGHERDATLSAVAAWAMVGERSGWWNLYEDECCPIQPFDTCVSYWMPIPSN